MKVSKFHNVYQNTGIEVLILDELKDIKNGKYEKIITQCRKHTQHKEYEAYKRLKIRLPIVTFSGTFDNGRRKDNLRTYSNFIILDIDNLDHERLLLQRRKLQEDDYVFSAWLSPSGVGLKALIRVDSSSEDHPYTFKAIKNYLFEKHEIELDLSGSDLTRSCFVSYDQDLFLNPSSEIFKDRTASENLKKEKSIKGHLADYSLAKNAYATEGLNAKSHKNYIRKIIKFLKKKELSITSSFPEWFRVATAISYSFSYDVGEPFFLNLCKLDKDRHNEQESVNMLKYCYNNRKSNLPSSITFATIIHYAKEKGFTTKKERFLKSKGT